MTISDVLLILVTFLGPISAIQVQKLVERRDERRFARILIFRSLMATRATRLAPEHVAALNRIDLEFTSKKDRKVVDAWRLYALQLDQKYDRTNQAQTVAWNSKVYELFIDLLFVMSESLGYDFSKEHLQRGIYYPTGHADRETDQNKVLSNAARVLAGEQSLKMEVVAFPSSDEAVKAQTTLQEKLSEALNEGSLTVQIRS